MILALRMRTVFNQDALLPVQPVQLVQLGQPGQPGWVLKLCFLSACA